MKETIRLSRVTWSHRYSQSLCGFRPDGDFIHTERVFRVEGNVFEGERFLYRVESWQPDGFGYVDN